VNPFRDRDSVAKSQMLGDGGDIGVCNLVLEKAGLFRQH
jgi:hypothetical protein